MYTNLDRFKYAKSDISIVVYEVCFRIQRSSWPCLTSEPCMSLAWSNNS